MARTPKGKGLVTPKPPASRAEAQHRIAQLSARIDNLKVFVRLVFRGRPAISALRALLRAREFYENAFFRLPDERTVPVVVEMAGSPRVIGPSLPELEAMEREAERLEHQPEPCREILDSDA